MSLLLGIDLGTTGLKCVLIDPQGRVRATALAEYWPDVPQPGWAQQDVEVWLQALQIAVAQVLSKAGARPGDIDGLGFSGQMHSTLLLDRHGAPCGPAILWLDSRSARAAEEFTRRVGPAALAEWIGNPLAPGFTLATLLWLSDSSRAGCDNTWSRAAHLLLPKDYLRYQLTDDLATDYTDASATGLLNVAGRRWSEEILREAAIPRTLLPPLAESSALAGRLTPRAANWLGLPSGLPVAVGAGDQAAGALGNGIIAPGDCSSTIGTGGQLFAPLAAYRVDPALRLHVFCHAIPNTWHLEAATLTAGMAFRWLRDEVLEGRYSYEELADAAAVIPAGAEGLFFLPYLAGERTPHMNPALRGVFAGLSLRHTWRHMARAVMEGVVFALRDGLSVMGELGVTPSEILLTGGAVRHPLWRQLQADIFGCPVRPSDALEPAAIGAALLGGVAAGVYQTIGEAVKAGSPRSERPPLLPDPERQARYHELHLQFCAVSAQFSALTRREATA